jgi:hypothetical protein
MNEERRFDQVRILGIAWLLLCLSFAANILEDTLNDFLGYYNATVLALYGHFSWFPRIDLSFREWFVAAIVADAVLLLLTPFAYRNSRFLRPIAYFISTIMLLISCSTIIASLLSQTVPSVHFDGGAPGIYTSPPLLAASVLLFWRLRSSAKQIAK